MRHNQRNKKGFTLTELLVLIAVGAVLTGLLVPDLSQTRSKLLQQACVANLKHWGMVMNLYAQDNNGSLQCLQHWQSTTYTLMGLGGTITNGYLKYLGGGDVDIRMHRLRMCPAVGATMSQYQIDHSSIYTYAQGAPQVRSPSGRTYEDLSAYGPPYYNYGASWPNLRRVPKPAEFLLLLDVANPPAGYSVGLGAMRYVVQPILDRHSGGVNVLFGDFHVAYVPYQVIAQQDVTPIAQNTWFQMN